MAAWEPRRPTLAALGLNTFWIAILSLPMWTGKFLAGEWSDQYPTGYAFRHWIAETWKQLGHMPLWNPLIMGGLPLEAGHGDAFYPTALLRLVLPTDVAMNLGFVGHYILAGLFTYLFLRSLEVSWSGAALGGLAYQLTGVLASLVHPGHDGKLFVSALLPLSLLALVIAMRRRRYEGYALLSVTVGLALLSPHYQMVYYLLIAAGAFALYLAFGERDRPRTRVGLKSLGLALGAVVLGFGVAWIQVWPFIHYLPFSPRAEGFGGFADSATYGIPWGHVPEFVFARFAGDFAGGDITYWGPNGIKFHSEYLGLPVVGLAVLGALGTRRRLVYWLGGVGLVILLVALSDSTPFYRLWWEVMPFVKQTRAPGMAFYVPAFVVAVFAAFGIERLEVGEGKRHAVAWLAVGAGVVLLAAVGGISGMARSLAAGVQPRGGPSPVEMARAAVPVIRTGALLSGLALCAVGGLAVLRLRRPIPPLAFGLGLMFVISADLWRNASPFWVWTDVEARFLRPDPVTRYLGRLDRPYRLINLDQRGYKGSALMAHNIPQLLGHHANELHAFDELMGGQVRPQHLGRPKLWEVMAVSHLLIPTTDFGADSIPGFRPVLSGVQTTPGSEVTLLERETETPYARLVPTAVTATDEQAVPTIVDPRFPLDRVVLLPPDAPVAVPPSAPLPPPLPTTATVNSWRPGEMEITLSPAAPGDAFLVVSENWYPAWQGRIDGTDAPTVRGNMSLITVPVPSGAQKIELTYRNRAYQVGRLVTAVSLVLVAVGMVVPAYHRRRSSG
jgi:hypothetical protein